MNDREREQMDFVLESFAGGQAYRICSPRIREPIIRSIYRMYGVTSAHRQDFPGAQPCSVMRENLDSIANRHYVVAEKTDGTRYLMLVTVSAQPSDLVVLIDRSLSMWIVPLFFTPQVHQEKCLFDGELVFNEQTGRFTYQIFDLISCGNRFRTRDTYIQRLKNARTLINHDLIVPDNNSVMDVMVKRFYPTYKIDELVSSVQMHQGCKTDGLIFTPVVLGVKPFRNREMFKWKDGLDHTVDFLLRYNAIEAKRTKKSRKKNQQKEMEKNKRTKEQLSDHADSKKPNIAEKQELTKKRKCRDEQRQLTDIDSAESDNRSAKKAKLEQIEPMANSVVRKTIVCSDRGAFEKSKVLSDILVGQDISQKVSISAEDTVEQQQKQQQNEKEKQQMRLSEATIKQEKQKEKEEKGEERIESITSPSLIELLHSAAAAAKLVHGQDTPPGSLSPENVDLNAFEFWLVNRSKELTFHSKVDVALNREFLANCAMQIASGDEMVVECRFSGGDWQILHQRKDRVRPNTEFTVEKTLQNISENITLEEIATVARNNRPPDNRDYRYKNQNRSTMSPNKDSIAFVNPFGPAANYYYQPAAAATEYLEPQYGSGAHSERVGIERHRRNEFGRHNGQHEGSNRQYGPEGRQPGGRHYSNQRNTYSAAPPVNYYAPPLDSTVLYQQHQQPFRQNQHPYVEHQQPFRQNQQPYREHQQPFRQRQAYPERRHQNAPFRDQRSSFGNYEPPPPAGFDFNGCNANGDDGAQYFGHDSARFAPTDHRRVNFGVAETGAEDANASTVDDIESFEEYDPENPAMTGSYSASAVNTPERGTAGGLVSTAPAFGGLASTAPAVGSLVSTAPAFGSLAPADVSSLLSQLADTLQCGNSNAASVLKNDIKLDASGSDQD